MGLQESEVVVVAVSPIWSHQRCTIVWPAGMTSVVESKKLKELFPGHTSDFQALAYRTNSGQDGYMVERPGKWGVELIGDLEVLVRYVEQFPGNHMVLTR